MANIRSSRRSGLVLRGGRMRRESRWLFISPVSSALGSASSALILNSLDAAALALLPFTIVRTRMFWHTRSDQTAATENIQVALGACVVTEQASAVGITAVPTPFAELGSDVWYMHEILSQALVVTSAVGSFESRLNARVDSRAMRKVEDGQDVIFVIENSGLSSGTENFTAGRFLIKLH